MSADRDVDRIVRSWLEEGVTALPDRVLDNVLDRLPATRQRRSWWPARRLRQMNTPLRIALAAAAVLVVALLGISILPKVGGVGSPALTPAPTPRPTPVPTLPPSGELAPGTWRSDFLSYTLPAGWQAFDSWGAHKQNAMPPNGMAIQPWRDVATVYSDPCHWQTTAVSVGPTVAELAAALVAQRRTETRSVTPAPYDITVDGFHGKQIELAVDPSVEIARCDGGYYKAWTDTTGGDRYNQGPGQIDLVRILDVNGRTLMINVTYYPARTLADRAELQAIVDSFKITP